MPDFDGFPIEKQVPEAKFEAATYELLRTVPDVRVSNLLYHRIPVKYHSQQNQVPQDIAGRRMLLFNASKGVNNVWHVLSEQSKVCIAVLNVKYATLMCLDNSSQTTGAHACGTL